MQAKCPLCAVNLKAEDINIATGIGKCSACNGVFLLSSGSITPQESKKTPQESKKNIDKPRTLEETNIPGGYRFIYHWKHNQGKWGSLLVACIWNGLLFYNGFYQGVWSEFMKPTFDWSPSIAALLFPFTGLIIAYWTACLFINRSQILLESGEVKVKHGPLPWFLRNSKVTAHQLKQLYVEKYISSRRNNCPVYKYKVRYIDQEDTHHDLLKRIQHYTDALYLEQKIEQRLSIKDEKVHSEHDC